LSQNNNLIFPTKKWFVVEIPKPKIEIKEMIVIVIVIGHYEFIVIFPLKPSFLLLQKVDDMDSQKSEAF
jgi:hypothetical protein